MKRQFFGVFNGAKVVLVVKLNIVPTYLAFFRERIQTYGQYILPRIVSFDFISALLTQGEIKMLLEIDHTSLEDIKSWSMAQNGRTSAYKRCWINLAKRIDKAVQQIKFV